MATKQQDTGTDIKSLALNFASLLLFVLPFAAYFDQPHAKLYCGVVLGVMMISLLVPPMGWMRPHPYSDMPNNKPYPRKEH
jgi:hypothetical protein